MRGVAVGVGSWCLVSMRDDESGCGSLFPRRRTRDGLADSNAVDDMLVDHWLLSTISRKTDRDAAYIREGARSLRKTERKKERRWLRTHVSPRSARRSANSRGEADRRLHSGILVYLVVVSPAQRHSTMSSALDYSLYTVPLAWVLAHVSHRGFPRTSLIPVLLPERHPKATRCTPPPSLRESSFTDDNHD